MLYPTQQPQQQNNSGMNNVLRNLQLQLQQAQLSGNPGQIGQLQAQIAQFQQGMTGGLTGSTELGGQQFHYPLYNQQGQLTPNAISQLVGKDYQTAYGEAKAAEEAKYQGVMGEKRSLYDRVTSGLEGYGEQQAADIDEGFYNRLQGSYQDLSSRGLQNTTIRDSASLQNERQRSAEQRRLGEDLTRMKTGTDISLSQDIAATMERKVNEYPDYNQMLQLAQGLGGAGDMSGFGYGGYGGFGGAPLAGLGGGGPMMAKAQRIAPAGGGGGRGGGGGVIRHPTTELERYQAHLNSVYGSTGPGSYGQRQMDQANASMLLPRYNMPERMEVGMTGRERGTSPMLGAHLGIQRPTRFPLRNLFNERSQQNQQQGEQRWGPARHEKASLGFIGLLQERMIYHVRTEPMADGSITINGRSARDETAAGRTARWLSRAGGVWSSFTETIASWVGW